MFLFACQAGSSWTANVVFTEHDTTDRNFVQAIANHALFKETVSPDLDGLHTLWLVGA
jgi:hypothetical protein